MAEAYDDGNAALRELARERRERAAQADAGSFTYHDADGGHAIPLALFHAPVSCFDHQSFEAPDWASMKVWGDHMASLRVPIVWGIGRHGPGNDVFFMVRDPDGNLAEISAEIEHCEPGRPAGEWAHEERTLNLWGKAILRS